MKDVLTNLDDRLHTLLLESFNLPNVGWPGSASSQVRHCIKRGTQGLTNMTRTFLTTDKVIILLLKRQKPSCSRLQNPFRGDKNSDYSSLGNCLESQLFIAALRSAASIKQTAALTRYANDIRSSTPSQGTFRC